MKDIMLFRTMVDFGLVVLIWIVQVIIYPFFASADKSVFNRWHRKYMWQITFFVAPLMFIQTGIYSYMLAENPSFQNILGVTAIISIWLHTFLIAVPAHNRLTEKGNSPELTGKLVRINWYRTVIWTLMWLMGLPSVIR